MKTPYFKSIYFTMQQLADITKKCILTRNFQRVEKCLGIADRLMRTGNAKIKNAVANVFVYSVTIRLETMRREDRERVFHLFPASLKAEYVQQINTTGG
ncbi:MAG: hypothetical protein IPM82_30725 [Saprospiraceae bacterium]|nr:hypothetical protein [Saprospiraceae bacterium]